MLLVVVPAKCRQKERAGCSDTPFIALLQARGKILERGAQNGVERGIVVQIKTGTQRLIKQAGNHRSEQTKETIRKEYESSMHKEMINAQKS